MCFFYFYIDYDSFIFLYYLTTPSYFTSGFTDASFIIFKRVKKSEFRVLDKHLLFSKNIYRSNSVVEQTVFWHFFFFENNNLSLILNEIVHTPMWLDAVDVEKRCE